MKSRRNIKKIKSRKGRTRIKKRTRKIGGMKFFKGLFKKDEKSPTPPPTPPKERKDKKDKYGAIDGYFFILEKDSIKKIEKCDTSGKIFEVIIITNIENVKKRTTYVPKKNLLIDINTHQINLDDPNSDDYQKTEIRTIKNSNTNGKDLVELFDKSGNSLVSGRKTHQNFNSNNPNSP